jgi:lysophospholipase L1-like esterase
MAARTIVSVAVLASPLLVGCVAPGRAGRLPPPGDAPLLYVALGDSTVAGIGASAPERSYVSRLHRRLLAVYPRAELLNLGRSGATSGDVVRGPLASAIQRSPGLVTISVGPNDITSGVTAGEFRSNLDAILAALAQRTRALVVVNLLPDLAVTPRFRGTAEERTVGERSRAFNAVIERLARDHGALVVDLYGPSRREVPRRPELVAADGYHPSDEGYAVWAALVWQELARRIPSPGPRARVP